MDSTTVGTYTTTQTGALRNYQENQYIINRHTIKQTIKNAWGRLGGMGFLCVLICSNVFLLTMYYVSQLLPSVPDILGYL